MDFDGLGGELDPAPAGAQLRERHEQARERAVARGGGENQRRGGLQLDRHTHQHLAHHRKIAERAAERAAMPGEDR